MTRDKYFLNDVCIRSPTHFVYLRILECSLEYDTIKIVLTLIKCRVGFSMMGLLSLDTLLLLQHIAGKYFLYLDESSTQRGEGGLYLEKREGEGSGKDKLQLDFTFRDQCEPIEIT